MNIRFHVLALLLLTFLSQPSFALERVEFVALGPYDLEPLNPDHFDEATSWAPEAFADFNGDKTPDLLSASNQDRSIELFYGIRDGGFEAGRILYQGNSGNEAFSSLVTGDWNLDGLQDFAARVNNINTIIALNQGGGAFVQMRDPDWGLLASADIDNDGDDDFIALGNGLLNIRLSSPGEWDSIQWQQQGSLFSPVSIQLADFDGDGNLDIGAVSTSLEHRVHYGDGDGGFSISVATPNPSIGVITNTFNNIADLNGDGLADLLGFSIHNYDQRTMDIFFRNPDSSFQDAVVFDLPWVSHNDQYAISDFNVDGFDDVAAFIRNEAGVGSRIRVMYGPYDNGFQWIDDIYVSDAEPLGLYAINTLPSGAADLMAIFHGPDQAVYIRWTDLENPHRFRIPKTMRVPEDVLTLSQAVRESINGDEISIAPGTYADRIDIQDGTYALFGRENAALPLMTNDWTISNSDCTIGLIQTNEATIRVEQSNLKLYKSKLRGVSSERSFPYGSTLVKTSHPALIIQNASGAVCSLSNCDLTGGDVIEATSESTMESNAGIAMLLQDCTNAQFEFNNTKIKGGEGSTIQSNRYQSPMPGGPGLMLRDSINLNIENNNLTLSGGGGTNVVSYLPEGSSIFALYFGPERGGPGLKTVRSTAAFQSGRIDGGLAGNGGVFRTNIVDETDPTVESFDGAMGGAGAQAFESSYIVIEGSVLNGGPGGEPNGEYGPRIEVDETSHIELINTTDVHHWFLYSFE